MATIGVKDSKGYNLFKKLTGPKIYKFT